jgi:hypothetical protein
MGVGVQVVEVALMDGRKEISPKKFEREVEFMAQAVAARRKLVTVST